MLGLRRIGLGARGPVCRTRLVLTNARPTTLICDPRCVSMPRFVSTDASEEKKCKVAFAEPKYGSMFKLLGVGTSSLPCSFQRVLTPFRASISPKALPCRCIARCFSLGTRCMPRPVQRWVMVHGGSPRIIDSPHMPSTLVCAPRVNQIAAVGGGLVLFSGGGSRFATAWTQHSRMLNPFQGRFTGASKSSTANSCRASRSKRSKGLQVRCAALGSRFLLCSASVVHC